MYHDFSTKVKISAMLQISDFKCPTERSISGAVFQKVNGKCYFFTIGGCRGCNYCGCSFQQALDQCKTVFGAGIFGKIFEPTSIEDNDAVLKAAHKFCSFSSTYCWYWIGVSNTPLKKYKSNNKPVSISTIPWASGEPFKTASETQCINAVSESAKTE